MGTRIRGVAVLVAVLVTGAILGTWMAQWTMRPGGTAPVTSVSIPSVFGERVRVEVLNGGGRAGMARIATAALRDAGFDVVEVGNWAHFDEPVSFVQDRSGRLETARRAADALGITDVRSQADTNLYADLTVVLGQDWTPDRVPDPILEAPERPWWDLRQYFKRPGPPSDPDARLVDPQPDEGRE